MQRPIGYLTHLGPAGLWFAALFLTACSGNTPRPQQKYFDVSASAGKDTLTRVFRGEFYEPGLPCGYVNSRGDTLIPLGRYAVCFSQTIVRYGIVLAKKDSVFEWIAIDARGRRLYEVYPFDNGPDYVSEGLFRIMRWGKIGYADTTGKVVITPRFKCAQPFKNGRARVSYRCDKPEADADGHTAMTGAAWFYIDINGKKIPPSKSGKANRE